MILKKQFQNAATLNMRSHTCTETQWLCRWWHHRRRNKSLSCKANIYYIYSCSNASHGVIVWECKRIDLVIRTVNNPRLARHRSLWHYHLRLTTRQGCTLWPCPRACWHTFPTLDADRSRRFQTVRIGTMCCELLAASEVVESAHCLGCLRLHLIRWVPQ